MGGRKEGRSLLLLLLCVFNCRNATGNKAHPTAAAIAAQRSDTPKEQALFPDPSLLLLFQATASHFSMHICVRVSVSVFVCVRAAAAAASAGNVNRQNCPDNVVCFRLSTKFAYNFCQLPENLARQKGKTNIFVACVIKTACECVWLPLCVCVCMDVCAYAARENMVQ